MTVELEVIRETQILQFAEMFFQVEEVEVTLMSILTFIGSGIRYHVYHVSTRYIQSANQYYKHGTRIYSD